MGRRPGVSGRTNFRRFLAPLLLGLAAAQVYLILPAPGGGRSIARAATAAAVTEYSALPSKDGAAVPAPSGTAAGPDGRMWFVDPGNHEVGAMDPSGSTTAYAAADACAPTDIAQGPDAGMWVTLGCGEIARFDPSGSSQTYKIQDKAGRVVTGTPSHITKGWDGAMWFTLFEEYYCSGPCHDRTAVGRITVDGFITLFQSVSSDVGAMGITSDDHDHAIFFAEHGAKAIGEVYEDKFGQLQVSEFSITQAGQPTGVASDPAGNIWFSSGSSFGHLAAANNTPIFSPWPDGSFRNISHMTYAPDTNTWFSDQATGYIGYIDSASRVHDFTLPSTGSRKPDGAALGPDGNFWYSDPGPNVLGFTNLAPAPGADRKLPIIFLPGVAGSYLNFANGGEAWPDQPEAFVAPSFYDGMKLADNGVDPAGPADLSPLKPANGQDGHSARGVYGLLGKLLTQHFYDDTLAFFQSRGYRPGNYFSPRDGDMVFPMAYDWRRSSDQNKAVLLDAIERVLRFYKGKYPQVDVIAHSQGGLVTRALVEDPQTPRGVIHKVVTLGTPILGAVKLTGVLQYKDPCFAPKVGGRCPIDEAKAQEIIRDFPGGNELAPSRPYFDLAAHSPIRWTYDHGDGYTGELNFGQVLQYMSQSGRNATLMNQADQAHQREDGWLPKDPAIQLLRLVGTDNGTYGTMVEYKSTHCFFWWLNCSARPDHYWWWTDGDGTVPLPSAALYDPSNPDGIDLRNGGTNAYADRIDHGGLSKDPGVLDFALQYLQLLAAPNAATPHNARSDAAGSPRAVPPGISLMPKPFSATDLRVEGPGLGFLADAGGHATGVPDLINRRLTVEDIPRSVFTDNGDGQQILLHEPGHFTGTWKAASDGEFFVSLTDYRSGDIASRTTSHRFAVKAGELFHFSFDRGGNSDGLAVTVDAPGGPVSVVIQPAVTGAPARDVDPPSSHVTLEPDAGPSTQVTVSIAAADNAGGSGIDHVEWALTAGGSSGVYTGPMSVPGDGQLVVRAIDRAGNAEVPQVVTLRTPGLPAAGAPRWAPVRLDASVRGSLLACVLSCLVALILLAVRATRRHA